MKKDREKIGELILNYLRKNPEAGDTLLGISRFWLELERIDMTVDDVAAACENLVNKGLIKIIKTESGRVFYKASKLQSNEINQ